MRIAALIVMVGVLALHQQSAHAKRSWVEVTTAESGAVYRVDALSITTNASSRSAWFEIDFATVIPTEAETKAEAMQKQLADRGILYCGGASASVCQPGVNKVKTAKQFAKFNCSARTMAITRWIEYRSNGTVISSRDIPDAAYSGVVPDSVGESMLDAVCAAN